MRRRHCSLLPNRVRKMCAMVDVSMSFDATMNRLCSHNSMQSVGCEWWRRRMLCAAIWCEYVGESGRVSLNRNHKCDNFLKRLGFDMGDINLRRWRERTMKVVVGCSRWAFWNVIFDPRGWKSTWNYNTIYCQSRSIIIVFFFLLFFKVISLKAKSQVYI